MTDEKEGTTSKIVEKQIELEGQVCVCLSKPSENSSDFLTLYSFDRGETWHPALLDAYSVAKDTGNLVVVGAEVTQGGEFEAFILAFVQDLQGLKNGESLRLTMNSGTIMVIKEQVVLTCRASTIKDLDLRMEAPGG